MWAEVGVEVPVAVVVAWALLAIAVVPAWRKSGVLIVVVRVVNRLGKADIRWAGMTVCARAERRPIRGKWSV